MQYVHIGGYESRALPCNNFSTCWIWILGVTLQLLQPPCTCSERKSALYRVCYMRQSVWNCGHWRVPCASAGDGWICNTGALTLVAKPGSPFSTTYCTWTGLVASLILCGKKLAFNCQIAGEGLKVRNERWTMKEGLDERMRKSAWPKREASGPYISVK